MKLDIKKIKNYNNFEEIVFNESYENYIFFHGREDLDNRCKVTTSFFNSKITDNYKIIYDEDKFIILVSSKLGDKEFRIHAFGKDFIESFDKNIFILDTTSLGFAEILLLLHFLSNKKNIEIKLFYVEPNVYTLKSNNLSFKYEFDLSQGFNKFKKIPPFSLLIDSSSSEKAKLITLLGFENDRLSRIIEDDDGARYDEFEHIIALPAFRPGWENVSLQRHYQELKEFQNLEFSPANNPYETHRVLERIQKNSNNKSIVVAPIGTKPHAIGAIIFLINSKLKGNKVGLIYDFPIKKENRTDGIGNIHEYIITSHSY